MASIKNFFLYKSIYHDIRTYLDVLKQENWRHIHYGYWPDNQNYSFSQAQDNLYQLLKDNISSGVNEVLDIGGGVGSIASMLNVDGYMVKCIVPDQELIKYGKTINPEVDFSLSLAENFKTNTKADLAVLIESYQYFSHQKKALFNIADNLKEKSQIIIIDEFFSPELNTNLLLGDLINNLQKKGYWLIKSDDITKNILPSIDFLIDYFKNNDNKPMLEKWQRTKNKYLDHKTKYLLLIFNRN